MPTEHQRSQRMETALQADLDAVGKMQPPGFHLDSAVAKFVRQTRSDERAAAWAAKIEQQPASGILANLIDRIGVAKLAAAGFCLFAGVATAGTLGVLVRYPVSPSRAVDATTVNRDPSPAPSRIDVTRLPSLPATAIPQASSTTSIASSGASRHRPLPDATAMGVEQEIAHMVILRKLVDTKPRRALAWAEQGHRQFTHGVLFEEREALYVLAQIKVHGVNAAKPRANAFLRRFPKGSFAARIEHAVKR